MASPVGLAEPKSQQTSEQTIVNDMVIEVATVNGSGSQSANLALMRAIFSMGIPISGKNVFPSNIQGLPTYYVMRVNEDGWLARREKVDFFVAMNAETAASDVTRLPPGAILIINEPLKGCIKRDDLHVFTVPFSKMVAEVCEETRLRRLVINMLYVGVVAAVLGMKLDVVLEAIDWQFAKKKKAAELNKGAATYGFDWAKEHLEPQKRFRLQPSTAAKGKILIEGNESAAIGMMFGGVTVAAWYPITPSSSLCEALTDYLEQYRRDPETGKATYAVLQAEDELGAIGMVLGAGWAGARAFTATSGPGLSLMAELSGLSYFAEIPVVIVDVQRMGPSTGLPTRTAQSDIAVAYQLSHGDCKHVLLLPGTMKECYEFSMEALELAEYLQTLVIVMSDLDLGMNKWMSEPFAYPTKPICRGKVLSAEELDKIDTFARYRDVDGDGIAYRTLPGTKHPKAAYFTRGTGHTEDAEYSESPSDWKENMDRLARKFETARTLVPRPVVEMTDGADIGIIAFGSSDGAVREAQHLLAAREKVRTSYLRLRALPVNGEVEAFIASHRVLYVVEQNRDGQMTSILRDEYPRHSPKLEKVLHYDGAPIHAEMIVSEILAGESSKETTE